MNLLKVENCNMKYRKNEYYSLKNVNIEIMKGDIVGLIGPNGAGKTTLIKIISGLLTPTEYETVNIMGTNIYKSKKGGPKIGLILNSNQLYSNLTVIENINFYLKLNKTKRSKTDISETLDKFSLLQHKNKLVSGLSTGMKQKLNIIKVFLLGVKLLILDEPTSGLDPVSKSEVHGLLKSLNRTFNTTILVSSHVMPEVNELCNKVLFLNKGEIILKSDTNTLIKKFNQKTVYIKLNKEVKEEIEKKVKNSMVKYAIWEENDYYKMLIIDDKFQGVNFIDKDKIINFEERNTTLEDIFFYQLYKKDL